MISHSQRAEYFERRYATGGDLWRNDASHERDRDIESTLGVLPQSIYGNGLELGCSVGEMTEHLASYCRKLTAVDCADSALSIAKERCRCLGNVTFKKALIPHDFPVDRFDLITMCDMGYYLSLTDLYTSFDLMTATLQREGHLLLVHRRGQIDDGPLDAETVHDYVRRYPGLESMVSVTHADYLLDLLQAC